MSQQIIAVGTTEVPVDLDTNFTNSQSNFNELYGKVTLTAAAANSFTAGKVGYLHTDGTVILTDANTAATSSAMLVMATASIVGGASGVFNKGGLVTVTGHGFAIGQPLFLSETAGEITNTAPGAGTFVRLIGYALDANTIDFRPDATWIEVAA